MRKKLLAEMLGTFAIVFAGTGAIITNGTSGGAVTHAGISLVFGLVVMSMIYALGDISGAHMNPAVTLGFFAARRFGAAEIAPYIISQCAGAILASVMLRAMFPAVASLGGTNPTGSAGQSFAMEVVLTFLLMFVALRVSTGAKEKGLMAGVAVGSVVAFEALFAGPVSGASMNPARSLGPALVSGDLGNLWIYLLATPLGAVLAALAHGVMTDKGDGVAA